MATTLDTFPAGSGQRSIYPWEKLLDGKVWELSQGTKDEFKAGTHDYHVSGRSFRSAAQQAATRAGGSVKTRLLDGGKRTVLQFVKETETSEED